MKFPTNISLTIERNGHVACYQSLESYVSDNDIDIDPEDLRKAIEVNELWVIRWYPTTPIGFFQIAAATLERALELANE